MSVAARTLNANFNGGLVSPLLDARADAQVYRNSCRVLENFIVRPYGGAFKRPGTEYGGEVKTSSSATRLIPFKRSTSTNYMLEFGASYIRFWTGGSSMARVESSPGVAYEVSTPYAAADLFALQFTRINDVMFIAHPSYAPRRLTRTSATSWTLEEVPWDFPPMGDINDTTTTITVQPNVSNWVTSTAYTVGQVRLQNGTLYMVNTAHTSGTFATDLAASRWVVARMRGPWERDAAFYKGDIVDAQGARYACISNHTSSDSTRPPSGGSYTSNWLAVGDTNLRLFASSSIFASGDVGSSFRLDIGANKRTIFLNGTHTANTQYYTEAIFAQGDVLVRSNWPSGSAVKADLFLEQSVDRTTFTAIRNFRTQNGQDGNISSTYEGPTTGAYYRFRLESTENNAEAQGYFIDAIEGVITGLFTISSYTSATEVVCSFALPDVTFCPCELLTKSTRTWYRPAFSGTNGYPRSVAFHEGRLFWAGTTTYPARIWSSRTDDYYNFLVNADDDASLDLTLAATEANQIEWVVSQGKALIVGTTGDEWTIDGGESDNALTPTNARARRRTRLGSTTLSPQIIADALLWVGRGGRRLHEFAYNFASDRYEGPDMTLYAENITAGGIVQTAFSALPDAILWAVTANGVLLGFTYDRAQQITAWHKHTTGSDTFESVATMYGTSGRDEVWFVVNRTINGSTKRYVERFYPTAQDYNFDTATDLFYVDCGKKVSQASSTTISGLSHLEAEAVSVWYSGTTIESKTVASAAISVASATTSAIVGIPITSQVQPMRLEVVLDDGTGQGRHWRPNRVTFLLYKSAGGEFADSPSATFKELDVRTPYQVEQGTTESNALYTGRVPEHVEADWGESVDFIVKHDDPVPFNLLGYILVSEVSGK